MRKTLAAIFQRSQAEMTMQQKPLTVLVVSPFSAATAQAKTADAPDDRATSRSNELSAIAVSLVRT